MPNSTEIVKELGKSCGREAAVDDEQMESESDSISAKTISEENYVDVEVQFRVTIFHLHPHDWRSIFEYMSENDIIALSAVCKHFQQIVQNTKSSFNLTKNYRLDADCFLNYALSNNCTSIDINYCKWLTPSTINEMILKTNLQHFHAIHCHLNEDCVRSLCSLQLQSLSFTYTNEWRAYFIENAQQCLPLSQTLIKLEMEYSVFVCFPLDLESKTFIYDVYMNVFPHCKQLQQLKLIDDFEEYIFSDDRTGNESYDYYYGALPSEFPLQSTPLPNLTNLEFCGRDWDCSLDLVYFVKAIFQDKVIPISNVDFGQYTCQLLKDGILCHPLILPNSSKFILRSYDRWWLDPGDSEEVYYDYYGNELSIWMGQTAYQTVFMDNISIRDFPHFANRIVSTSRKSIKELYFRDCLFFRNVAKGIEIFAINCPQITMLNMTIKGNAFIGTGGLPRNHDLPINEAVIEAIASFKNLKELILSPKYLKCNYKNEDDSRWIKMMPFWKVIQGCEQLNKICLMHSDKGPNMHIPTIHADNLYDIAHCKNLQVLQLNRFEIEGEEDFQLSRVTNCCAKLKQLSIVNVFMNNDYILNLENSLRALKELKLLRIKYEKRYLTETFLNTLCGCEQLENISFTQTENVDGHSREVEHLIQVLPKLKNLFNFELEFDKIDETITEQLVLIFDKIKEARSAFSGRIY